MKWREFKRWLIWTRLGKAIHAARGRPFIWGVRVHGGVEVDGDGLVGASSFDSDYHPPFTPAIRGTANGMNWDAVEVREHRA